jgi:hypothetical protein
VTARTASSIGVLAVSLAVMAAAESRPVFSVGALRRDGIVIPFATYDKNHWETNWPVPKLDLIVPVDLRAVPSGWWGPAPAPRTWNAWIGRAAPRAVDVTQLDWVDVHCVRQVGLKTTYQSDKPVPPRTIQPYPKDGLVVSPPQPVEPIEVLAPSDREVQALADDVRVAFNKAEREVEARFGHSIKRQAREGIAPEIEAVYAYGHEPRVYYIEATRSYRRLGQTAGECVEMAFATGWFSREREATRPIATVLDLLRCDRYGASYMFPFGVLRLNGKLFWLAQFSGWDQERFVVVEIGPKTVEARVNVYGGGC